MTTVAFNTAVNPFGAELKVMMGSDIAHWDVPDMSEVLAEAWEMVDHGWIDEDAFTRFTFVNPSRSTRARIPRSSRERSSNQPSATCLRRSDVLDLLLKGGTVIDGTGDVWITGDVGVRDGLVTRIGQIFEDAERTLDVSGLVVCPGFIDVHTHYDVQLLWDPTANPSVLHGVTTVLGGHRGFSIAPLSPGDAGYIQRTMAVVEGIPLSALKAWVSGPGRRLPTTSNGSTADWP